METRKRARTATASDAPPEEARRDSLVTQLFDGVLRSAADHLCRADQPLAAEVWASGLLAVWEPRPGDAPVAGDQQRAFGEALIRHARAQGTPEAMAVLIALGAVAPSRLATKARTAAAGLSRKGVPTPAWAPEVGRAAPTEAWVGRDTYGDQEIVIVGFSHPAGTEHTVCVLVDHTLGGVAKDAYPGGPLAATLDRWREAEDNGIRLAPVDLADAAGRIADALLATDFSAGGAVDDRLGEMRALLDARLAALPTPARPGRPEMGHDERDRLVAEFLSSPEAADLLAEPSVVMVCHSLVAYRCDYGDGDPLRWSPTLAAVCLLDHFPSRVGLDGPDVPLVPDVLSAWVRFAGRTTGLPAGAVARITATVETCRDEFTAFMADEHRFGEAKRVSTAGLPRS